MMEYTQFILNEDGESLVKFGFPEINKIDKDGFSVRLLGCSNDKNVVPSRHTIKDCEKEYFCRHCKNIHPWNGEDKAEAKAP